MESGINLITQFFNYRAFAHHGLEPVLEQLLGQENMKRFTTVEARLINKGKNNGAPSSYIHGLNTHGKAHLADLTLFDEPVAQLGLRVRRCDLESITIRDDGSFMVPDAPVVTEPFFYMPEKGLLEAAHPQHYLSTETRLTSEFIAYALSDVPMFLGIAILQSKKQNHNADTYQGRNATMELLARERLLRLYIMFCTALKESILDEMGQDMDNRPAWMDESAEYCFVKSLQASGIVEKMTDWTKIRCFDRFLENYLRSVKRLKVKKEGII